MAKLESEISFIPSGWEEKAILDEPEKVGISRKFVFKEYKESVKFATMCADLAEKYEHHPEIRILFLKVQVISYTHDTNSVTVKDTELAAEINKLYNSLHD